MTDNAPITWSVLIPVKLLARAKSRLAALAGPRRGELALALAGDTVAAVLRCDQAARAIVITDDPVASGELARLGALVVPDEPDDGLNAALRHGAAHAAARWPGSGTAALSADLPALRPAQLTKALRAAAAWPSSFVAHAAGGAAELNLDGVPGLRRDVDTPDDLRDAVALGIGPRTAPLAAELLRCAPRGR